MKQKYPFLALLLMPLLVLALLPLAAWFSQPTQSRAKNRSPREGFGLYELCSPARPECLQHLDIMASGGFQLVLNYQQMQGTIDEQLRYAAEAERVRMRVIWNFSQHQWWNGENILQAFPRLAQSCTCTDNLSMITTLINTFKHLPSTWGYYIGDEIAPDDHPALKRFTDLVARLDPNHPRLFIACAQCDHDARRIPPYTASLRPMLDTAEFIGVDWYPVGSGGDTVLDTARVATELATIGSQQHKQTAMVLQAVNLGQYNGYHSCEPYPACMPFPSRTEMQTMLDITLSRANPDLVLWYSYFDLQKTSDASLHWHDLRMVIASALGGTSSCLAGLFFCR